MTRRVKLDWSKLPPLRESLARHAEYVREDPERWWGPRRVIDWLFPKLPFAGWWHKWVTRKEAQK